MIKILVHPTKACFLNEGEVHIYVCTFLTTVLSLKKRAAGFVGSAALFTTDYN